MSDRPFARRGAPRYIPAMRFALRSLLFAASCALALACGESQDTPSTGTTAGASGSAGAGGSTAQGGGGVGGSAAGSLSGGTAGAGGGAAAGASGNGGSSAGSSGGGAGGAAGGAGMAGSAGSAGAPIIDHDAPGTIVVLGSSTAAGTGPKDPKNAWVERYRAYLAKEFKNFELINLAVGGYTTWEEQPDDFVPPQGKPTPNKAHNITFGLSKNPDAILINLPGNDTQLGSTLKEQTDNFARMTDLADKAGVLVWVATTQPRNFGQEAQRMLQMQVRDAINTKYGAHALDFWTPFAEADGKIKAMYDSGDGIHMNDDAHALLAQEVIDAKVPEAILSKP
jgi:lysophospholipase L1-like esterase